MKQNDKRKNTANRWSCKRERERERELLAKIRFVNHAQKTNILRVLKNHKNIKEREIGYVDRIISYV